MNSMRRKRSVPRYHAVPKLDSLALPIDPLDRFLAHIRDEAAEPWMRHWATQLLAGDHATGLVRATPSLN